MPVIIEYCQVNYAVVLRYTTTDAASSYYTEVLFFLELRY
jgi:hypothetical protein